MRALKKQTLLVAGVLSCVVSAWGGWGWLDEKMVMADFRDETFTLNAETGTFMVESRKAPGRVYARGRVKGFAKFLAAGRMRPTSTAREEVYVMNVAPGVTNNLLIAADYDGVRVTLPPGWSLEGTVEAEGVPGADVFAVAADRQPTGLEAAIGPAAPTGADSIYNRRTDGLVTISGGAFSYDVKARAYHFAGGGTLHFSYQPQALATRCHVPFKPINANCDLKTPPVGWMTWYAVKFKACDDVVMRNARAFMRHFRGYTDERPVLWVDWEWYHEKMGSAGAENHDMITPRKTAYPRGLRAVSDDLRALGFRPALWVSFVGDVRTNALWRAHPEWVLGEQANWSGAIWGNPTAPGFCEEYIPQLVKLYRDDWGFEAFKWDTLPNANWIFNRYRARLTDPRLNAADVFRKMMEAGRKAFGPNVYLLGCAGYCDREILETIDVLDASRVGDDIFDWNIFIAGGVNRILHYYPLHNTAFWADADNLVLRAEFSTLAQARTRVTVYGLAGVPITVGDDFEALDAPRIEMLKRVMPVVPTHAAALGAGACTTKDLDMTVDVTRDFGTWQLKAWSSISTNTTRHVRFAAPGQVVWDFWNDRLMTETEFDVPPGDTRLVRVTPRATTGPTLVSVSRHITQGAYELKEYATDATGARGIVRCPGGETVKVTFLLPTDAPIRAASHRCEQKGRLVRLFVDSPARADVAFSIAL